MNLNKLENIIRSLESKVRILDSKSSTLLGNVFKTNGEALTAAMNEYKRLAATKNIGFKVVFNRAENCLEIREASTEKIIWVVCFDVRSEKFLLYGKKNDLKQLKSDYKLDDLLPRLLVEYDHWKTMTSFMNDYQSHVLYHSKYSMQPAYNVEFIHIEDGIWITRRAGEHPLFWIEYSTPTTYKLREHVMREKSWKLHGTNLSSHDILAILDDHFRFV